MPQTELRDDRGNIIRPGLRLRIVFWSIGRLRHAVAAKIEGHQAECVRQLTLILPLPAKMVLRPPMDEEDGWSIGLAPAYCLAARTFRMRAPGRPVGFNPACFSAALIAAAVTGPIRPSASPL